MSITFAISEWSGWAPTDSSYADDTTGLRISDAPDVSLIPPMLRRRLNFLGRSCASEIMKHSAPKENVPLVYCSQHGDITRTVGILMALANNEPVSPMHFSLAVHNAITGVMSIQNENRANISAIAAGQEGLLPTILEAVGILSIEHPKVLCVICDVPLPDIYQEHEGKPETAFAVSFLLTRDQGTLIELKTAPTTPTAPLSPVGSASILPLDFINFLSSGTKIFLFPHNGCNWSIRKV